VITPLGIGQMNTHDGTGTSTVITPLGIGQRNTHGTGTSTVITPLGIGQMNTHNGTGTSTVILRDYTPGNRANEYT